ncbi:MAG: 4-(cytidine 5'-diphospho)-2-C-methyl-D-erythritol kinase [Firmicutes bacterium]|nr:4-(cytidine 5'-diphospho)-2-C-methyl-D-erythritol kinase [Bacillota bacterium]
MNTIELKAKAKVNLILNVLGKRDDGYHEVQMVMQAIDLADDVKISWERQAGLTAVRGCAFGGGMDLTLDPGHKKLPSGPKNLAYQAALRMHDAFHPGQRETCGIVVVKNIPLAAGLAGGSTDAAAVIWGLARLWGLAEGETDEGMDPDVRAKLFDVALAIGSDVPFCLAAAMGHEAAVAEGRGEKLTYIDPLDARIETFTPKLEVSTAKVYGALKPEDYAKPCDVAGYLAARTVEEKCAYLGNHLQAPAVRLFPKIGREIERLSQMEGGLATLQSGSGPTVFTVFKKEK